MKKNIKYCYNILFLTVILTSTSWADWESDANVRIEQIRKRNLQITVLGSNGQPVADVNVRIEQVKHRFAFGTCIRSSQMNNNTYKNFILSHFEWAVCENDTKWGANEGTRDVVTYTNADNIYNWCAANGIKMRGHCLFWEQENSEFPTWLAGLTWQQYPTASEGLDEVNERIDSAVNHFKGKFLNWDVDNEMLSDSFFTSRLGTAGIVHMFNAAKALDPNGGMFMNEYSGNSFNGYDSGPYVTRANTLLNAGATIDGYGIQAHLQENVTFEPQRYYDSVLQPLAVFNKPIWATEFDASHTNATTSADNIENFMRICFSHANVEGIMFWGFMDGQMWRSNAGLINSSGTLNERGVRYESLMDEWTTEDSNYTNAEGVTGFRGFHGTYEITLSKPGEPNTEIHTIELEPGTGTEEFVLHTGFYSGPPDVNAPTPNPMTWASVPAATGPYTITMTATTATDNSTPVQYYFECTTDANKSSGWQASTTYAASGLYPSTLYTFRVKARDSSPAHNETGWSGTQSATTDSPDITPPSPNPMTWASVPTAAGASTITMTADTATDVTSPPVQYYFECTNDASKSSDWQSNPTYIAGGLTPLTQYSFRVKARDSAVPTINETGWSGTASATTQAPPTDVNIIGSWVAGTTHTAESGYNRVLIFIAHGELNNSDMNLASVTYGGQPMTKIIERNVGTGYRAYVAAFILNEAGITAADTSGTFVPSWNAAPESVSYSSVFFESVDQTTSIGASASAATASSTPNPITTSAIATSDGDMVAMGATCGNNGSYTVNNSFIEGTDQSVGSNGHTGVTGRKAATGASETPSATYSSGPNRQVIIGFVLNHTAAINYPPAAPTNLTAIADNGNVTLDWDNNGETDLAGYNVYRSTTQGSGYSKLNTSLITDSNYIDSSVVNGTPYYYVVTAVDSASSESGYSNEANATPDYQDCQDIQDANLGLASDLNHDCYVNYEDFKVVADNWLSECTEPDNCGGADFTPADGTVDFLDFSDFAGQWMQCNNPADLNCPPNWE